MSKPNAAEQPETVGGAMKWLAWTVFFATVLFTAGAFAVVGAGYQEGIMARASGSADPPLMAGIAMLIAPLLTVGVAQVILFRSSNWRIGWLLAALGGIIAPYLLTTVYTVYALGIRPETILPLKWPAAWFQSWSWFLALVLFLYWLPQLFPTGRPLSPRWRIVFWLTLVYLIFGTVVLAFAKLPLTNAFESLETKPMNPYGFLSFSKLEEFRWLPKAVREAGTGSQIWPTVVLAPLLVIFSLLSFISLALRFWRSRGDERQQLKWIAYALAMIAATYWAGAFAVESSPGVLTNLVQGVLAPLSFLGLPLAIGFSILKYRLYDIDSLINRRFYRRKYDTAQTLAEFSAAARVETDLERLTAELLRVVRETMEPEQVSLWLRKTGGRWEQITRGSPSPRIHDYARGEGA